MRTLLPRIAVELHGFHALVVLKPIRIPRTQMVQPVALGRAVELAKAKLATAAEADDHSLALISFDADDDPPCTVAPEVLGGVARDDIDVAVVLPNPEFETWFVAAADSLSAFVELRDGESAPLDPERTRSKKGWIQRRFRGSYSPTVDQAKLTAHMDLSICRERCPSFDKLCRELARRIDAIAEPTTT